MIEVTILTTVDGVAAKTIAPDGRKIRAHGRCQHFTFEQRVIDGFAALARLVAARRDEPWLWYLVVSATEIGPAHAGTNPYRCRGRSWPQGRCAHAGWDRAANRAGIDRYERALKKVGFGAMLKGRLGIDEARIPQKSRNGLVYVERCRVAIDNGSLVLAFDDKGEALELPYQRLNALLLGPGTTVTHEAVRHLSAHGTCLAWVGTDGTRLYTTPPIFERDSDLARKQAGYWASTTTRVLVAKRMYAKRFGETPRTNDLDALRGMEAARIKKSYEILAQQHGLAWKGRRYDRHDHDRTDLPNQAINHAVTALEAAVAIAVQATATLPPLGFLHEDSAKAWVLDVCDLYRTTVTVPIAFACAKELGRTGGDTLDRTVRRRVSRHVREKGFVDIVIDDIKELLA